MEQKAFIAALNLVIAAFGVRAAYLYGKFAYQRRRALREIGFSHLPLAIWWACTALTLEGLFYGAARVLRANYGINLWQEFDLILPLRGFTLLALMWLLVAYWRAADANCLHCVYAEIAVGVGAFGLLAYWLY